MNSLEVLCSRAESLDLELSTVIRQLSDRIESKLGDGWKITQQTDGFCLCDIDGNNYRVPLCILPSMLELTKDQILLAIEAFGI